MQESSHTHSHNENFLVKFYHQIKRWLSPGFIAGWLVASTITFPLEHLQWEKVWPFYLFTEWMEGFITVAPPWISTIIVILWLVALFVGIKYAISKHDKEFENGKSNK